MTALSTGSQKSIPPGATLVCLGGAPGAGKTTVGGLLAAANRMCLIDLDSVTTPLVEAVAADLGMAADLDAPRFAALRPARYACLEQVVSDNLRSGVDVVAVAPFTTEVGDARAWREQGAAWGAARVVLCWLDLEPAESDRRAAARGLPRDLAKAGARPASASVVVDREGLDLVLDGAADPEVSCAAVLAAL